MSGPKRTAADGRDAKFTLDDLATKKVQVGGVYPNVEQDVILITEDKVRLCLNENFNRAARAKQWITIAGAITTFILTLTTATFRDFGALTGQEWRGVVIACLIATSVWFLVSLRWAVKAPKIEDIVRELKEGSQKIAKEERLLNVAGEDDWIVVDRRTFKAVAEHNLVTAGSPEIMVGAALYANVPDDIYHALLEAQRVFREAIAAVPNPAQTFLDARGIGNTARDALGLGYAPDAWDHLLKALNGKFALETLHRAGLVSPRKSGGGFYDRFRSRLTIPIQNERGLCGFAAVSIDGSEPVVLLSPEAPYFTRNVATAHIRSRPELRVLTGW